MNVPEPSMSCGLQNRGADPPAQDDKSKCQEDEDTILDIETTLFLLFLFNFHLVVRKLLRDLLTAEFLLARLGGYT